MTGRELLVKALALFAETETTDYEATGLIYINMLLDETHDQDNRMRRHDGLEEQGYRQIETLEDELPCVEKLAREALTYGLAAKLYFDEDDNARLSMFNEEYANCLAGLDRYVVKFEGAQGGNWLSGFYNKGAAT